MKFTVWPVRADWFGGEQVGAGGGWTLTVTELWAVAVIFVQLSVKVFTEFVRLPVGWEPLVATELPFIVQVSAFVEVQVKVVPVL